MYAYQDYEKLDQYNNPCLYISFYTTLCQWKILSTKRKHISTKLPVLLPDDSGTDERLNTLYLEIHPSAAFYCDQ